MYTSSTPMKRPWDWVRPCRGRGFATSRPRDRAPATWSPRIPSGRSSSRRHLNSSLVADDVYRILKPEGGLYIHFRDWITLKVRVIEAPSLSFKNGGGAGLEIVSGNTVYQTQDDDGRRNGDGHCQVRNDPVYWNPYDVQPAEWNWEAGTAAGSIDAGTAQGEGRRRYPPTRSPAGKDSSSGILLRHWMATVGIPSSVTNESVAMRDRDNWIQVFVGDPDGPNNPNSDPLTRPGPCRPATRSSGLRTVWDTRDHDAQQRPVQPRSRWATTGTSVLPGGFPQSRTLADRGDFIRLGKRSTTAARSSTPPLRGRPSRRAAPRSGSMRTVRLIPSPISTTMILPSASGRSVVSDRASSCRFSGNSQAIFVSENPAPTGFLL